MKVRNMTSPKTGREVPNQFVVETNDGRFFQSYKNVIVYVRDCYTDPKTGFYIKPKIQLDETYWNYSVTTSKYRNQFLGETTKETQAKIDRGEYLLTDLN